MYFIEEVKVMFYVFIPMGITIGVQVGGYSNYCFQDKVSRTIFHVKSNEFHLKFTLCDILRTTDADCGVETAACLQKLHPWKTFSLGSHFIFENNSFKSINGGPCTTNKNYSLIVHINDSVRIPNFSNAVDQCSFHVNMRLPSPNCGLNLFGKFIDLSPLAGSYHLQTSTTNFSINICGEEPSCPGNGINACAFQGQSNLILSQISHFTASYNGDKNLVSFNGAYSEGLHKKILRKLQIDLICDWAKTEVQDNDLTFIKQPQQGKRYLFQLETSYGCIHHAVPWVVAFQKFLVYNISNVCHKNEVISSIDGSPSGNGSKYYMNFCGPGRTHRKDSYAEVTEQINARNISRGTFLAQLEVTLEGNVRATIDGETKCMDKNHTEKQRSKSIIDFICDREEHQPRFLKYSSCNTYFKWRTPEACPKYITKMCDRDKNEEHDCVFRRKGKHFNITSLAGSRVIKGQDNHVAFEFDVCRSVFDKEIPCMKYVSVAMKNLSEIDVSKKLISLGRFNDFTEENGNLVLHFKTGSFCGTTDYQSAILFECSEVEEEPIILPQTKPCFYEFSWKTKYACPYYDSHCLFKSPVNNISIDFAFMKPIKVRGEKNNLEFHVCERFCYLCSSGKECSIVKFKNITTTFLSNMTALDVLLDTPCKNADDFNKVTFNFMCDLIENNDHVEHSTKSGCHLILDIHTNTVCSYQTTSVPLNTSIHSEHISEKDLSHMEKISNRSLTLTQKKCKKINSPFTNRTVNIENIDNNEWLKNHCPAVTFNDTHRFVKLAYNSTKACEIVSGQNLSYEIYLLCTNDVKPLLTNNRCLVSFDYNGIEYCDFFKQDVATSSWPMFIGIVVGCSAISVVLYVGFLLWKRRFVRHSDYLCAYERNVEL